MHVSSTTTDAWLARVTFPPKDPELLRAVLGPGRCEDFARLLRSAKEALGGRRIVNINSTPSGGGVAEMLMTVLGYLLASGLDVEWWVLRGNADFFQVTKRIHNGLYGGPGDGGPLEDSERASYEAVHSGARAELRRQLRTGDVVIVHDPQPAGLACAARDAGAVTVWRCHVGIDVQNAYSERSWSFLRAYVESLDGYVFSQASFVPRWIDPSRVTIITPTLDPLSTKNQELRPEEARRALVHLGLLQGLEAGEPVAFTRRDGTRGHLHRRADVLQAGPPPPPDRPLVVQISRWDRMKDMPGVMAPFVEWVMDATDAHLSLVGPAVSGYADDPEGAAVLQECMVYWRDLPQRARARIHLACLPMSDLDENAIMVNALQRHASVVTQKSISEGFGLTVTEAMWKHRPVVGSRTGGICEQIIHNKSGILVNPNDHRDFGTAVAELLHRPARARAFGAAAHERASDLFLLDRQLVKWAALLGRLLG